ncbi:hypothetical protein ACVWXN_006606 [Bradyrhizobium sp. i1.4.4]
MSPSPTNKNCALHRWRQSLSDGENSWLRHRLQAPAEGIAEPRDAAESVLLHSDHRGSGMFLDPFADRLARTATPASPRRPKNFIDARTPQGRGQHGYELAVDAMELAEHIDQMVLFSDDTTSAPWSRLCSAAACGHRDLHDRQPAADDRWRAAPPGRRLHRPRRVAAQAWRRSSERPAPRDREAPGPCRNSCKSRRETTVTTKR